MNFGGVHFFYGLLFVGCSMALTIIYVYGSYLVFAACVQAIYKIRYRSAQNQWLAGRGPDPAEVLLSPPMYWNWILLKKITVFIILLLSMIYIFQRVSWMKNTNAHYKAKEYWVAGQVIFAPRRIMGFVLHPENVLMRPYTGLQQAAYNLGVSYLPGNDAERYVWENAWFLYLYTRRSHRPYGVGSKEYEPDMVVLLDRCWQTMEGMATQPISDPAIQRKYLIEFPLLADYYSILQGHYTGKLRGSGTKVRKTLYLIRRVYLTLDWMDQLWSDWDSRGMIDELKSKYPSVLCQRQDLVLWLLQDLALTIAGQGKFDCAHPILERLYKEYQDAMSDDPGRNFFLLYSKKNRKQAMISYRGSVYSARGGAANYLLSNICQKKMPEETYCVLSRRNHPKFYTNKRVEYVYEEELKNLKGDKK